MGSTSEPGRHFLGQGDGRAVKHPACSTAGRSLTRSPRQRRNSCNLIRCRKRPADPCRPPETVTLDDSTGRDDQLYAVVVIFLGQVIIDH